MIQKNPTTGTHTPKCKLVGAMNKAIKIMHDLLVQAIPPCRLILQAKINAQR